MADFIKREDVLAKIDEFVELNVACGFPIDVFDIEMMKNMIEKIPAEDVAPVVHGHWVDPLGQDPYCSVCGFSYEREQGESAQTTDYCGRCGAKMDEETENV